MTEQLSALQNQLFTMEFTAQQRDAMPTYSPQKTLEQRARSQAAPLQAFLQRCQQRQLQLQAENGYLQQRIAEVRAEAQKRQVYYKRDAEFLNAEIAKIQEQCKAKNAQYKQTFKQYERDIEILEMERDRLYLEASELAEKFTAADVVEMLRKLRYEIAD